MTSRSYFGKINSILGSVVPLAMFSLKSHYNQFTTGQVAIVDNSKGIEQAERGINGLGKAVNVVSRKVKANRKTSSDNVESIKDINKEMTYVKTQVVEFCGYQSSWGKEVG